MAARLFAAACATYAGVLLALAVTLPERVPLHFGADLQVDRTGDRAELLVAAALAGGLIALLFGGLARWAHRLPLHAVNVPHPQYWKSPEHEGELRRRIRTDLLGMGAATLAFLAALFALVGAAAVAGTGLSGWAVVLLAGFFGGLLLWVVWLGTRRYRPPASGSPTVTSGTADSPV